MSLPRRVSAPVPSWARGDPLLAVKFQQMSTAIKINQTSLVPTQQGAPPPGVTGESDGEAVDIPYVASTVTPVEIPIEESGVPTGETITAGWDTQLIVSVPAEAVGLTGPAKLWRINLRPTP